MSVGFGRSLDYRTIGTRLASFLASRFYRSDYKCPVSTLTLLFFDLGKRSGLALPYSIVKVLLIFQLYHPTKGTIVH